MQTVIAKINRIIALLVPLALGGLVLVVPLLRDRDLYQSIQSSPVFGFLYAMLAFVIILAVGLVVKREAFKIQLSITDMLLGVYVVFVSVSYWNHHAEPLHILTFAALALWYLGIRTMNSHDLKFLLIGVVVSGTIQAIYGNLQLWGFYPSNHALFRITGSFFNPGPFAGYLAGVFPIALVCYLYKTTPFLRLNSVEHSEFIHKVKTSFQHILWKGNKIFPSFIIKAKSRIPLAKKYLGNFNIKKFNFAELVGILSLVFIGLVLPASRSRAAWMAVLVSSIYVLFCKYKAQRPSLLNKHLNSVVKKTGAAIIVLLIALVSLSSLYHFKKDSADGRLLIWKVGAEMIQDNPFWGHGIGKFAANYMNYQAAYFESNPDAPEVMVADNVLYPFNEFLKIAIETGLIGLAVALAAIWSLFFGRSEQYTKRQYYPQPLKGSKDLQRVGSTSPLGDLWVETENQLLGVNPILLAARAGLLSILVFSLFSYPSEILPIKMLFVAFAAIVASPQKSILIFEARTENDIKRKHTTGHRVIRHAFLLVVLLLAYPAYLQITKQYQSYKSWKDASDIYNVGAYPECLDDFKLAYPQLKNNGNFLVQYGKALEMAGQPDSSIILLNQAKNDLNNTILYTTLGNNYKALAKTSEAEQAYLHAWNMAPAKFYPLYLLAKLYDETGQNEKAIAMAKKVMGKEVKIESTAIEEIIAEMQQIRTKQASLQISNKP